MDQRCQSSVNLPVCWGKPLMIPTLLPLTCLLRCASKLSSPYFPWLQLCTAWAITVKYLDYGKCSGMRLCFTTSLMWRLLLLQGGVCGWPVVAAGADACFARRLLMGLLLSPSFTRARLYRLLSTFATFALWGHARRPSRLMSSWRFCWQRPWCCGLACGLFPSWQGSTVSTCWRPCCLKVISLR